MPAGPPPSTATSTSASTGTRRAGSSIQGVEALMGMAWSHGRPMRAGCARADPGRTNGDNRVRARASRLHPHGLAATTTPHDDAAFDLRSIAVAAFAPSLLFGLGEGAILPVIALSARELGGSVAEAALIVTLLGIGSLVSNIPASIITMRWGERWAIVGAALWAALAMAVCLFTHALVPFAAG